MKIFKFIKNPAPQITIEFHSKPHISQRDDLQTFCLRLINTDKLPIINFEIKAIQGKLTFKKSASNLTLRNKPLHDLQKNTLIPKEEWLVDFAIANIQKFNGPQLEIESELPLEIILSCNYQGHDIILTWKAEMDLFTKLGENFKLLQIIDKSFYLNSKIITILLGIVVAIFLLVYGGFYLDGFSILGANLKRKSQKLSTNIEQPKQETSIITTKENSFKKAPRTRRDWNELSRKAAIETNEKLSEWKTIRLTGYFEPDSEMTNIKKCIGLNGYSFAMSTITSIGADLFITGQSTSNKISFDLSLPKIQFGNSMPNLLIHRLSHRQKDLKIDNTELIVGHYYIVKAGSGYAVLRVLALNITQDVSEYSKNLCEAKFSYLYSTGDIKKLEYKIGKPFNMSEPR